jgi:hypothetical protein
MKNPDNWRIRVTTGVVVAARLSAWSRVEWTSCSSENSRESANGRRRIGTHFLFRVELPQNRNK